MDMGLVVRSGQAARPLLPVARGMGGLAYMSPAQAA